MIFISDIPHLKVYKQKTYLPRDEKAQTMYSIVFINNNSLKAAIDLIKNDNLNHNNKYHFYYIDQQYQGKLINRSYRLVNRKERVELYDELENNVKYISTLTSFDMAKGRNIYFDLAKYNTIFFNYAKKARYELKVKNYIDYIKGVITAKRFDEYKIRTICIDVESWVSDIKTSMKKKLSFDNPIFILYFAMYKYFDKFKELGDINIIFYSNGGALRLNPSLCDDKSFQLFKRELSKLTTKISIPEKDEDLEKEIKKEEIYNSVVGELVDTFKFVGDEDADTTEFEDSVKQRVDDIIESEKIDEENLPTEEIKKKLEDKMLNDEKLLQQVSSINQEKKVGRSSTSLKRDEELRKKQKEIKLEKRSIDDYRNIKSKEILIPAEDVTDKVNTTNKNMTKIKYPNFEKSYNETLRTKDIVNNITFLNEKSIPVYVRDIKVEDSSDELNLKETYTVDLEDANRVRHKLKFDMPVFVDDKFMYLGGNKKIIIKQLFMKPVVKTGPDEVQVCSNYNKIFIRRYGNKFSSKIEKLKKALLVPKSGVVVKYGNNLAANGKYKSMLEYDELSKDFTYIKIANAEFYFNQDEVQKILVERKYKVPEDQFCVGFFVNQGDPITFDINSQKMGEFDIVDFMLSVASGELVQEFDDATAGKKFMYTRATIMKKQVPLILLLGYVEGLSTVLRKANIRHYFSDKRPKIDHNQGMVQFVNGYLVYDKYPFENSLLMNAFADIPTKAFEYEEFDSKDAYLTIFDIMFGSKIIGNAFDNFYEFMIDPITREVLEDLNYPTEFVPLILFANALLADNAFIKENNMNLYRVRSNEMVNALLYKSIADAYIQYRMTANNNNPVKISVPQDVVLKKVLTAQTVEDYSVLNPIVELEKSRAITPKGVVGMNLDDAYTQDKRSYDKTMLGILAISTSPDANCGIVRQLTLEPNIVGPRGYIEVKDDKLDELNDANLFSPAELLSPLGVTRDDSIRTAMATKQSKHIVPIEKASPVLISNGAEQVIQYHLSNDFIIKAKDDGEVVEVNEKTGLIVVEYKNGQHQAIDINPKVVKNGAGGFYLSNQLSCNLTKGKKFKKNEILASDKHFFSKQPVHGNRFNIGSLQKVACMSAYSTYEDSTFITKKLSRDMASEIVMQKAVTLGKNATVDYMINIGDKVQVGDELIRFETSFEEDTLNKFLSSVGDELKEEIKSIGKTPIKSKYSGTIEDIKIYSTVDLEELSPSLKKIVSAYYDRINQKKKTLNKYDKTDSVYKCNILLNEATNKIETKDGKVKGNEVGEGVLIEFYVKYRDTLGVGDKVTFFTALKSIIGETIPEGYEPYSEFRPQEEVSSVIAPSAIAQRMTPSILLTMFANKVMVELKRKLQEVYTGHEWVPVKEQADEYSNEEILIEALDEIYRARNIDDAQSYFAKKEFNINDNIYPLVSGTGSKTVLGTYIRSSKQPNCKIENNQLIAIKEITKHEELTISIDDFNALNDLNLLTTFTE